MENGKPDTRLAAAATPEQLQWQHLDITQWRNKVANTSAEQGIRACLALIEAYNPDLNAFERVLTESALARARELDQLPMHERGALHGVPMVIKSEISIAGVPTTFGTSTATRQEHDHSWSVRKLIEAGAVIVGTTRMPEFGCWAFTESESLGITRNPLGREYTTGGSSGGTAVAVAAGIVPAGMAADGGGSIRIPAAQCGLFGLKPQRGRVSLAPFSSVWLALGTVGPLTRSVADSALIYDIISGNAPSDKWQAEPIGSLQEAVATRGRKLKVGVVKRSFTDRRRPCREHMLELERVAKLLSDAGHEVSECSRKFPNPVLHFAIQFFAGPAEEAGQLKEPGLLEQRIKDVVRIGNMMPQSLKDWSMRKSEEVGEEMQEVFRDFDVLLTPTLMKRPEKVPVLHGKGMLGAMIASSYAVGFTVLPNVAGVPAAHIPTATAKDGLSKGVQIIGPANGEEAIMAIAAEIEDLV